MANKKLTDAHNLEILNLSHNKIEHSVTSFFKNLAGKINLRVVNLSYNFLSHVQNLEKHFQNFIQQTPNIEFLNFAFTNLHNNLSAEDIESIG